MYETHELKVVLSIRHTHPTQDRECDYCKTIIPKKSPCLSVSIVDRFHETKERIYYCTLHTHIHDYTSPQDLPYHHQQYLLTNRFITEIWDNL